jgi:hypothetical protein
MPTTALLAAMVLAINAISAQNIPGAAGILSMSAEKEIVRPLTPLTLDTAGTL